MFAAATVISPSCLKIDRPGAYPLYEFTSSPLTSRACENPELSNATIPTSCPGTLVGKRQFGLIRLTGPEKTRHITLESYDQTARSCGGTRSMRRRCGSPGAERARSCGQR